MRATTRRLWVYGLSLVLPALAVGALALGLLARERVRLAEREVAAFESRRSAIESRARLIAENIELLVADVQTTLMATLQEAPADEPRAFLGEWHASNPLVREVFRATADGRLIWSARGDTLAGWLAAAAPWRETSTIVDVPPKATRGTETNFAAEPAASSLQGNEKTNTPEPAPVQATAEAPTEIARNVQQYQRARLEIQGVARMRRSVGPEGMSPAAKAAAAPESAHAARSAAASFADSGPAGAVSKRAAPDVQVDIVHREAVDADVVSISPFVAPPASGVLPEASRFERVFVQPSTDPVLRSGWSPWRDGSGARLFGWRELPDRTVIGLELGLDAIKARLGEVFPAILEPGEAYALKDASDKVWHQSGEAGLPVALVVPLNAEAFPGWSVVAYWAVDTMAPGGTGFFALGASLIALLVFAILGAGALILRQANISEREAVQKTSFVANVSHELKTPLTTIRLYAELLAEGRVRDEGKRSEYLATIGRETQRLGRLVGNVLDFSRLEQGMKRYERTSLDLAGELRRLADTHAPRLAEAGLELKLEVPEISPVTTDRDAVEQIVLNLLDNACKYAAEGGEVTLAAQRDAAGGVRVTVADRGPGVPEAQRERIFEKFHRVDERLTAEKAGSGLGLSIARQLARGLGGELRCDARSGGGAEFVLTLPPVS